MTRVYKSVINAKILNISYIGQGMFVSAKHKIFILRMKF